MQIYNTVRYHISLNRLAQLKKYNNTSFGKALGKQELSYISGKHANWYNCFGKQLGISNKLYMDLSFDSGISLWGIYLPSRYICNNTKISMHHVIHYNIAYNYKTLETNQRPVHRRIVE